MPLPMTLVHQLRPALAPQVGRHHGAIGESTSRRQISLTRSVMRPCTSPTRNTVWRGAGLAGGAAHMAGLAQVDRDGAGDASPASCPSRRRRRSSPRSCSSAARRRSRPAPGIARSSSSPRPCRRTWCRRRRCRLASPSTSCCTSVRCSARTGTVNSGTSRRWLMRRPLARITSTFSGQMSTKVDVLAGLHHVRPGIAADRAGADDRDPTHSFSPGSTGPCGPSPAGVFHAAAKRANALHWDAERRSSGGCRLAVADLDQHDLRRLVEPDG